MEESLSGKKKNLLGRVHDLEERAARASPSLAIVSVNSFQQIEDVASTANVKSPSKFENILEITSMQVLVPKTLKSSFGKV